MGEPLLPNLTLLQLRERHSLTIPQIADAAGVKSTTVYRMLIGQPISREEAESILGAVSSIADVLPAYSLENVDVVLFPNENTNERG